jgi:hypothetical protein
LLEGRRQFLIAMYRYQLQRRQYYSPSRPRHHMQLKKALSRKKRMNQQFRYSRFLLLP